ncbi:MAG: outer membrane beta-barrel protein [Prevotellaceae bacterium]|jgi:hypothetical protein|nr:outer membrane beta-barrel protein [Prevotellaceae bacterium]
MKHIKYTFLSVCCLLAVNIATAQFSVYGSAGISGLKYNPEGGTSSTGSGFGGGISYFRSMSRSWEIGLAAEMATYSSKASFGTLSERYEHGTGENKSRISYSLKGYEEKQNITALSIPLILRYHYYATRRTLLYLSGGVKLGLPVSTQASINPGTVDASGEYEYEGQTYTNLPQHGFPEGMKLPETKSKIDLGYSVAATLEAGMLFKRLYIGLFLDYGLNDMRKTKDRHALEYQEQNSSTFVYNSILNTGLVDKINLFSTGLKIGIRF